MSKSVVSDAVPYLLSGFTPTDPQAPKHRASPPSGPTGSFKSTVRQGGGVQLNTTSTVGYAAIVIEETDSLRTRHFGSRDHSPQVTVSGRCHRRASIPRPEVCAHPRGKPPAARRPTGAPERHPGRPARSPRSVPGVDLLVPRETSRRLEAGVSPCRSVDPPPGSGRIQKAGRLTGMPTRRG